MKLYSWWKTWYHTAITFILIIVLCPDGVIGSHARLKILWSKGRAGSIPALGTHNKNQHFCWFLLWARESKDGAERSFGTASQGREHFADLE